MTESVTIGGATLYCGDCRDVLSTMPDESVNCCVTSPPYFGLRDYHVDGQIGLEPTPDEYVAEMVAVFREVRRVLRDDATLWLNLGDSYASAGGPGVQGATGQRSGRRHTQKSLIAKKQFPLLSIKTKDLIGIPWRVAFALQADGWYLRSDIVWHKPNPMPESVRDRPTKAHEYVFLLSKSEKYYFGQDELKEGALSDHASGNGYARKERISIGGRGQEKGWDNVGGLRNTRSVWTIATKPFAQAHFATFPPELAERCIKGGCPVGGTVLDPFSGAGTTALVADRLQRRAISIELNPEYHAMAVDRLRNDTGELGVIMAECVTPEQDRLL